MIEISDKTKKLVADAMDALLKELEMNEALCHKEIIVEDVIKHMAARINWNPDKLSKYLMRMRDVSVSALFNILVKEIALMFDENYPKHIKSCDKLYVISTLNGEIAMIDNKIVTSYKSFAAFRTYEDAEKAIKILLPLHEELFGCKSED